MNRSIIFHNHDDLEEALIEAAVRKDLPLLRPAVEEMLKRIEESQGNA
ncbi:MAG: hypothetical protein PWP23_2357 [Candidatus Sumerlaeota bacterium]|nr:hypothetical protein [Candidatus Sumerlaeota bacterium]